MRWFVPPPPRKITVDYSDAACTLSAVGFVIALMGTCMGLMP